MTTDSRGRTLGVLLFPAFELLDVFGPLQAFGNIRLGDDRWRMVTIAERAGAVESAQGPRAVADATLGECPPLDGLLVPGGLGTRKEVANEPLLDWIRRRSEQASIVASVCTGAALLARAGVLDGRRATTNKFSFSWVVEQGPKVEWVREARWVEDGKFATSSGVSAGIDLALRLIEKTSGTEAAERVATGMEYDWHRDPSWDPFARVWKLV